MCKIVTIYLSDDEARRLQEFCDENKCTQYSALKTAVKQILSEPGAKDEENLQEVTEESHEIMEGSQEEIVIKDDETEESLDQLDETEQRTINSDSLLKRLIRAHAQGD
jgi:predicted transcriptional regulator